MHHHTTYGYRLQTISTGPDFHWIFLPGGPGLGSEYMLSLCEKLQLPGTVFLADFPRDGTNDKGELTFSHWRKGLLDLLTLHPQSILVTHSFSGMFALSIPEIEDLLAGLVLMNTTTANTFFQHVNEMRFRHDLPDLVPAASVYHFNPTRDTYREFWNTYKYYCFTHDEMAEGEKMIPLFAFNNDAYYYAIQNFYADYQAAWFPSRIPFMTIAGESDFICPPNVFQEDERFKGPKNIHHVIPKAGHCSWVRHFDKVKACFDDFIPGLRSS